MLITLLPTNWENNIEMHMPSFSSEIKLMNSLQYDRDVRITASDHEEIQNKMSTEDLPPLPESGLSRILALVHLLGKD